MRTKYIRLLTIIMLSFIQKNKNNEQINNETSAQLEIIFLNLGSLKIEYSIFNTEFSTFN